MIIKKSFYKFVKFCINTEYRFMVLANLGLKAHLPSDIFLKKMYKIKTGQCLNINNPKTYTEKLQWLKLFDHRMEYKKMVDKYEAKDYVAQKIGQEYVVPLLGVWNRIEDIDFENLPQQFVLKTTHDSGGVVVCKDKSLFDVSQAKKTLQYFLKRDYYCRNREWPYKDLPHRVIAESYLEDRKLGELRDYKFFTFNGEPKVLYIAQGRGKEGDTFADFFDMEFNHLPFTIDHDMAPVMPEKPENFDLMKELAKILSKGIPQLRVDFYEVDGHVYFGEMTFFHCSGMELFHPEEWNYIFGDWLTLPPKQSEDELCE